MSRKKGYSKSLSLKCQEKKRLPKIPRLEWSEKMLHKIHQPRGKGLPKIPQGTSGIGTRKPSIEIFNIALVFYISK